MAGEHQLEPAAETKAVDGGDDGNGQPLDAVKQRVDRAQIVDHVHFRGELGELADVGADDEAPLLARRDDEPADLAAARALLDLLDDPGEFLQRAAPKRVLALALAVELGPRDPPLIDAEAPVLQVGKRLRHGFEHAKSSPHSSLLERTAARAAESCSLPVYSAAALSAPRELCPTLP